jgi:hypothetical protein
VCFRCVHVLIIELKALFIVISPLKAASCLFILSHFILRRQQEYIHQKMTLPSSLLPTSSSARRTYCIAPLFFFLLLGEAPLFFNRLDEGVAVVERGALLVESRGRVLSRLT